ncbi:hypothetical protein EYF80_003064 [Liparis tanakae]|uniref:Uncharacterized protein n=1 Tax=Liparis tanakae TaxID=230148 RepID=A0A4Z2J8Q3_9TELE|nr:hypothetical protein EYF80_003064 [Liparis tanakae]
MSYFCRPNPVDDALDIIAVGVQGREAFVLQISVMLLQTKGRGITVDMRQNISPYDNSELQVHIFTLSHRPQEAAVLLTQFASDLPWCLQKTSSRCPYACSHCYTSKPADIPRSLLHPHLTALLRQ